MHSQLRQSRDEMTARLLRAIENPHVHIIGHPTTRLIGHRPPIDVDLDAVFDAAARTGTALEINSFPDRLDLDDELSAAHDTPAYGSPSPPTRTPSRTWTT